MVCYVQVTKVGFKSLYDFLSLKNQFDPWICRQQVSKEIIKFLYLNFLSDYVSHKFSVGETNLKT